MVSIEIVAKTSLWMMLVLSICGLVTALVLNCRDGAEDFIPIHHGVASPAPAPAPPVVRQAARTGPRISNQAELNKRCGPKCQHVHGNKGVWETPPSYYPNLPEDPTACNTPPNRWSQMSSPESIKNLTKKIGKERYICNRSCPPQEVACGTPENGVATGVMDSVQNAGMASAETIKSSGMIPPKCGTKYFAREGYQPEHQKNYGSFHENNTGMGFACCGPDGIITPPTLAVGTEPDIWCKNHGGHALVKTAGDCYNMGRST